MPQWLDNMVSILRTQNSFCFVEADDEEQAEQLAMDNDSWQGNPDRYEDDYEVELA